MKIIVATYTDADKNNEYLSILTTKNKIIKHLPNFKITQEFDWKYGEELADELIQEVQDTLETHRIRLKHYHSLTAYRPQDETFVNHALLEKVQMIVKLLEFG